MKQQNEFTEEENLNGKNSKRNKLYFAGGLFIGIIPFLFVVYLLLGPLVRIIKKDYLSNTMYIVSDKLNIRSDIEKRAYIIGSFKYGDEVKVYKTFNNEWAEVSVEEKKGYMSLEYLVSPEMFHQIDGMYGNDNAKKYVKKTIYRKAISTYLTENNYTTNIPDNIRRKLYGKDDKREAWQIFTEPWRSKYNTFCYGDYDGDKKQDAAFILKNINTGQRRLIVLSLKTKIPGKFSKLIYSKDLTEDWFFIKNVKKGYRMIVNNEKKRLELDGIIIGTNRAKSLNDAEELLIYNGKDFESHKQP